jgi:23S rRNA (cytosine1962-C5)-methyltransferase
MAGSVSFPPQIQVETSPGWIDYELLDSGNGEKLERFGSYTLIRPEPEAIWKRALPDKKWQTACAFFKPSPEENGGHWIQRTLLPDRWEMRYQDLRFWVQLSASRHLGVFPEQASQWVWIREKIRGSNRSIRVLNLFGYTGLATLSAVQAGARVTHVDASKKAVSWARENQELSGLIDKPVRWIVDDALKFIQREARRNSQYEGIILDPPKFGRGPKGEVWEFYKLIPELLEACFQVLAPEPLFLMLTAYAVKASSLTLYFAVKEMMDSFNGQTLSGEVVTLEKSSHRIISNAVFCRWEAS